MIKKYLLLILILFTIPTVANIQSKLEKKNYIQTVSGKNLVKEQSRTLGKLKSHNKELKNHPHQHTITELISKNYNALFNDKGSPRIGSKNPKLTIVYFTDYNCIFCKKFEKDIQKIIHDYPQVSIVIKPLSYHNSSSLISARMALTVWEKNPKKFLQLHELLLAKEGIHTKDSINKAMKAAGIYFKEPSKSSLSILNVNFNLAQQFKIQGTPAMLIGGKLIKGALSYTKLKSILNSVLNLENKK